MLTVKENLLLRGSFYGFTTRQLKERIEQTSIDLKIDDFIDQKYGTLSGGKNGVAILPEL